MMSLVLSTLVQLITVSLKNFLSRTLHTTDFIGFFVVFVVSSFFFTYIAAKI